MIRFCFTALVGVRQRPGNRQQQRRGILVAHGLPRAFFERAAPHILHHQVGRAFVLAEIMGVEDIAMVHLGQRLGLALKTLEHLLQHRRSDHVCADDLDGHLALQAHVERRVHRRHAPLAELLDDVVPADGLSGKAHRKSPFDAVVGLCESTCWYSHGDMIANLYRSYQFTSLGSQSKVIAL